MRPTAAGKRLVEALPIDLLRKLCAILISVTMQCAICQRELSKREPVYRVRMGYHGQHDWHFAWGVTGSIAVVCSKCKAKPPKGSEWLFDGATHGPWFPAEPCQHCGRPVFVDRQRRGLRYFVCSEQCRIGVNNRRASMFRPRPLDPEPKPCATCGEAFTPKRSDALYCSPACKQRAYRKTLADVSRRPEK